MLDLADKGVYRRKIPKNQDKWLEKIPVIFPSILSAKPGLEEIKKICITA